MGRRAVILLDTCALIFDALEPARLGRKAARLIEQGARAGDLACSDISLWETAMLVTKGRLALPTTTAQFLSLVLEARRMQVVPISPAIAQLACGAGFPHADPADRIIAATAMAVDAPVVTCDARLRELARIKTVW